MRPSLRVQHGAGCPSGTARRRLLNATIVSPVTRAGEAQPGANVHPGHPRSSCRWRRPTQTTPVHTTSSCALAAATLWASVSRLGPVWPEAATCGRQRVRRGYSPLVGLLAVSAQRAVAASLLELPLAGECNVAGEAPDLHEVLADVRW